MFRTVLGKLPRQVVRTDLEPSCADRRPFRASSWDSRIGFWNRTNFTKVLHNFPEDGSPLEQAKYSQYEIRDAMEKLRAKCERAHAHQNLPFGTWTQLPKCLPIMGFMHETPHANIVSTLDID